MLAERRTTDEAFAASAGSLATRTAPGREASVRPGAPGRPEPGRLEFSLIQTAAAAAIAVTLAGVVSACGDDAESGTAATSLREAFRTADSLRDAGAALEAAGAYLALRDSLREAGNAEGVWRAQLWWGDNLVRRGRLDSAYAALDRAMELAGDDPRLRGWTHYIRSYALWQEGAFGEALVHARGMRSGAEASGDRALTNNAFHQFGRIYSLQGRHRDALREHEASLRFLEEIDGSPGAVAYALNEIAIDYRHLGRYADARRALERSVEIRRESGNRGGLAFSLGNLASLLADLGEHPAAIERATESLELLRETGTGRSLSNSHRALADMYRAVGNLEAGRAHLDSALAWAERGGSLYGRVGALEGRGLLELEAHDAPAAARSLERAREIADSAGLGNERAVTRATLARVRILQGRHDEALALARSAVAIADALGDPGVRVRALEALGAALEASGRTTSALERYRATMELLESWRGRLALGDLRTGVTGERARAYDGAVRLLLATGDPARALAVSERAKARLLLELMARGRAETDTSEIGALRSRLRAAYASMSRAAGARHDSIVDVIERLADELARREAEARATDPVAGAARYPAPASTARIREGLLRGETTLLVYHWGERDVFGWLVRRDAVRGGRLGHPDSLAALVEFAREALFDPGASPDWRPVARRAYRTLIEPLGLAGEGTGGRPAPWLVVPDGPLASLPFEALLPGDSAPPAGVSRTVRYGPSASVLLTLAATPPPEGWERAMLAVGDPRPPRDVDGTELRGGGAAPLGPLPFAAREARELARSFEGEGADVLIGDDATREAWAALEPRRYRYVHFAAHAIVSDRRPGRTRVVLSDGGLDLAAIRATPLSAGLVTLSACESGLGRHVSGEGIIGLPHAFLAAGARAAVVTLWKVPDRAAYEYMRDLYARLARGEPPARAMRDLRARRIGAGAHPATWAGFVLIGSRGG